MNFRIADTFTASLPRLTGDEQKAVQTRAFDLQIDPVNPGRRLHKLHHARDKNFWSGRVSRDIRSIVHKTADFEGRSEVGFRVSVGGVERGR